MVTDPLSVAEMFNEYFSKVTGSEGDCLEMEDFKDHARVIAITKRNVLHNFTFKPVAENYIRKILHNLNPRKAVGCDNISQRLLRLSAYKIRVWPF